MRTALGLVLLCVSLCFAQSRADDVLTSNLVFVAPTPGKIVGEDDNQKIVFATSSPKGFPAAYWNFELPPREYGISLPGSPLSVKLATVKNQTTFLRISPYKTSGGSNGIAIAGWIGVPDKDVDSIVESMRKAGFEEDTKPAKLPSNVSSFKFLPDAPWEVPPPK